LTNVYYLQTSDKTGQASSANVSASPSDVSLAKLGNEMHGPEDAMYISKEQVLFWENLKDSGKVSKAIKAYLSNK
jgi:hypothetical protein